MGSVLWAFQESPKQGQNVGTKAVGWLEGFIYIYIYISMYVCMYVCVYLCVKIQFAELSRTCETFFFPAKVPRCRFLKTATSIGEGSWVSLLGFGSGVDMAKMTLFSLDTLHSGPTNPIPFCLLVSFTTPLRPTNKEKKKKLRSATRMETLDSYRCQPAYPAHSYFQVSLQPTWAAPILAYRWWILLVPPYAANKLCNAKFFTGDSVVRNGSPEPMWRDSAHPPIQILTFDVLLFTAWLASEAVHHLRRDRMVTLIQHLFLWEEGHLVAKEVLQCVLRHLATGLHKWAKEECWSHTHISAQGR